MNKEFYAYDACSSEVAYRAGTLEDLLNKVLAGCNWGKKKEAWNTDGFKHCIGLTKREPYYFYSKKQFDDDDNCKQIEKQSVINVAIEIGLIK